jgi:hypothetical protein
MVLLNFIAFSSYSGKEFFIFFFMEVTIYVLFVTKFLKRLAFN